MTEYVPAPMARGPDELVESILRAVDPRLAFAVRDELRAWRERTARPLSPSARWVLAGHRAAGKATLLPLFAELSGRPGYDLDHEIESTHRRSIRDWLREDAQGFRAAERDGFRRLPARAVVAVGGGFLSLHADRLAGLLDDLQEPINRFFDTTLVMAEDERIRSHRLALLGHCRSLLFLAGDFSRLVVESD